VSADPSRRAADAIATQPHYSDLRAPHYLNPVVASDRLRPDIFEPNIARALVDELRAHLRAIGWTFDIRLVGEVFMYGAGTPD
jgi:hypothetical protein